METPMQYIREKPLLSLAVLFAVSRAILYSLFPFHVDFLPWLIQILDVSLLKNDLWTSIYYLHSFPPLFNLYVGLVVSTFPENMWGSVFTLIHFVMGISMTIMTYWILKRLAVPQWLAFSGGLLFICHPLLFRYEILPLYTYPLAFLILLSTVFLIKFLESGRRSYMFAFLAVPLVMVLSRNFFHIIFYFIPIAVGLCAVVYATRKHLFKTVVVTSVIFLAIGLVPNIRNEMQYGVFSSSSSQGMSLFPILHFVPKEKIQTLIDEGVATGLALIPQQSTPEKYYDYYNETPRQGTPVLNALYKTWGAGHNINYNNWIYAKASKEYQQDTFAVASRYPGYVAEKIVNSIYMFFGVVNYAYFDSVEKWMVFNGNPVHRVFQAIKYFALPFAYGATFCVLLWMLGSKLVKAIRGKKVFREDNPVFIYALFLLLYVFGVAVVVEFGENATPRVPIDPLLIILGMYFAFRLSLVREVTKTA